MLTFLNPSSPCSSFQRAPLAMQALPSQGHGQSWDPRLQSGLWGSPVLHNPYNLSRVCIVMAPCHVCQPPGALKRGQASPQLSPGGDCQSPHYLLCPSNGVLPNCLFLPPCPAGNLSCSLPEPGRLIKTCAVLTQGMHHDSGASGTGTACVHLLVLQQQTLITAPVVSRGSSCGITWGTVFPSRQRDPAVPK